MKRWIRWFITAAAVAAYFLVLRRQMLVWGAEGQEPDEDLPGDWIIGDKSRATHGITIFQEPEEVWPWIAQVGRGAGYYSLDYFINGNLPSADYLLPDLPPPSVGDWNQALGKIENLEDGVSITWVRRSRKLPFARLDSRRTYLLRPRGIGASRLIVRITLDWYGPLGRVFALLAEPLNFCIVRGQLLAIKQLAESWPSRRDAMDSNRNLVGSHQADPVRFA